MKRDKHSHIAGLHGAGAGARRYKGNMLTFVPAAWPDKDSLCILPMSELHLAFVPEIVLRWPDEERNIPILACSQAKWCADISERRPLQSRPHMTSGTQSNAKTTDIHAQMTKTL